VLRPSHADYTLDAKFGLRAVAGGGRSSARETIGRVAAGALAEDLLETLFGIDIVAWVEAVADVDASGIDEATVTRALVDAHDVRCPDPSAAQAMEARILDARKQGDSVGGVVRCVVRGMPRGLGEPVFGKLTAELASALMSLPASRAFEIGEGFAATRLRGSTHNDAYVPAPDGVRTATNRSGGVQGGISTGEPLRLAVAFKPVATIFQPQDTVTREGAPARFAPSKGRHDPCVVPRAVPMVEAMVALTLLDAALADASSRVDRLAAAFAAVPARYEPAWSKPADDLAARTSGSEGGDNATRDERGDEDEP
jgi:chorismate synthase